MAEDCGVGIDIAKATLDVALSTAPGQPWQTTNDEAGWAAVVAYVEPLQPRVIVLEATGGYETGVASALTAAGERHLEELRQSTGAPIVLLAPGTSRVREGPWTRVVRRPTSIGSLVQAIETLIPLAPEARQPID